MTTVAKSKRDIPISFWPLSFLTLIGVGLAIYRLAVGLGPATNLNDHFPWGIWITFDLFLSPVAGAAFTISLLGYFFGYKTYRSIVRPAVLAGFIGYGVVGALLFMDIGRWHQFYNVLMPGYMNIYSSLEIVAICITLYTVILIIEIAPVFLEAWNIQSPIRLINGGIYIIAGAGIVLSSLQQFSLGSIFLLVPYKLHPLWWTPALPVGFFIQALIAGLSTAAIAVNLTWRGLGLPLDRTLFHRLGLLPRILLAISVGFRVIDRLVAGKLDLLFTSGSYSLLVWLEIILGMIVPLGILFSRLGKHVAGPFWAGVFTLMGIFIDRLVISWVGLAEPTPMICVPHWIEIMTTVGMISGAFLVYGAVARYFDLFPDKH